MQLWVQLAQEGDVVDDATTQWPADRALALLGTIALTRRVPDDDLQCRRTLAVHGAAGAKANS